MFEVLDSHLCIDDPFGAEEEVFKIAKQYQLHITVGVAREMCPDKQGRYISSVSFTNQWFTVFSLVNLSFNLEREFI
jgi:hypothetical protein